MQYNESNFIYLKKTNIEKYYEELVKAEHICEYFPTITKIIVRKVTEGFLKDIAEQNNIESNVSTWNLLNNIKLSSNDFFPEEIYNEIKIILINGYEHISCNSKNIKFSKNTIEILRTIQKVLFWYVKRTEVKITIPANNLSFIVPSTIEYIEKEAVKINNDITLKNTQINSLRKRIIDLASNPKMISEINNAIILIKEEKLQLEKTQILMNKKIEIQKKQVLDIEKDYKVYKKRIDDLKEKFDENQELMLEKESQLLKVEIQKQELRGLIWQLDEQHQSIKKMEMSVEEEVKAIRSAYEHLLNLTNEYQDILETIEFSYDKELQKVLGAKRNNIKIKINFEEAKFNENIINYNNDIAELKRKVLIYKELLNDNIKREIKYESIYSGFLRLEKKELRIIYTIINSTQSTFNFLSKPKELISRLNEEKFLDFFSKNFEELKNINDNEIKLILYYKLMRLSKVSTGKIYNRKRFIQALDGVVDKAYEVLIGKKDFKYKNKKLDAIYTYYMEKVISALKNKNSSLKITDDLVDRIYKNIKELKQKPENIGKEIIYYDKFNIDIMPQEVLKAAIKSNPFDFLSIMVEMSSTISYKEISAVIFEVETLIEKKSLFKGYIKDTPVNYSNEYFMILLFLSSETAFFNKKQQEEVLPLIVMLIISVSLFTDDNFIDLESYNNLVEVWKHNQQKYNDIFMEQEEKESNLELLIKEKQALENNHKELLKLNEMIVNKHNNYKDEFKSIVMNSEKRILLPSYDNYNALRSKKEKAKENINEAKNKFGTLKSIFSPEVWRDQTSKFINESNMIEAEKILIEEAKQKPYFKNEYSVLLQLEDQIKQTNELINKNEYELKNKNLLIDDMKNKISELQKQLTIIKDAYPDLKAGYYF